MTMNMNDNVYRLPSPEGICCFITGAKADGLTSVCKILGDKRPILPVQTHSLNVAVVTDDRETFPDTDALITQIPGLPIGVRTADCVPIILYAPDIRAVAAVHAGWKGTLGGIVSKTIDRIVDMGADVSRLHAMFGVSICSECYEVDQELADKFITAGFASNVSYPGESGSRPHLDLQGMNAQRMRERGVLAENIILNNLCTKTSCDESGEFLFNSWRSHPGITERNLTIVSLI